MLAERGGHPESRAIREKTTEQMPDRDRQRAEALAQKFVADTGDAGRSRAAPSQSSPKAVRTKP